MAAAASRPCAQELERYTCYRNADPIHVDGKLDEASWTRAPQSGVFVHIVTGEIPPPSLQAWARLLWDDTYLYIGITLVERDVRGTLTQRDSPIYRDNDAELFIAGRDGYYEFEINALDTIYEVFWVHEDARTPGGPFDGSQWDPAAQQTLHAAGPGRRERWGFLHWDFPGLLHAVHVDGTLNKHDDVDNGWTVELALPWQGLALLADGRSLPPKSGDVWRIDCSRFEQGLAPEVAGGCAGWTWNKHGVCNSHMPELFTYVHFSTEKR